MNINLPLRSFSFFKLISSTILLSLSLIFPLATATYLVMMAVGRAHSFGAWFAMWRAGKLNWVYGSSVLLMAFLVTYISVKYITMDSLLFITYFLFIFHFFYDEFDLQQEKKNFTNLVASICPLVLISVFLIKDFLHLSFSVNIFIAIFLLLLALEVFFVKEINWFFVSTKIISLFIVLGILSGFTSYTIINIFLLLHYFYWFILPVYNLYLYKRSEVSGFVVMLLFLVFSSVITSTSFLDISNISYSQDVIDTALRGFLIGTIIHIFSTSPFGYWIGLPKRKYGIS